MSVGQVALLSGALALYAVFSGRLRRSIVTGPMIFLVFGVLVGPEGLGWLDFSLGNGAVEGIFEVTLALVLFVDASEVNLGALRWQFGLPGRMLVVGLPLVMLLGLGAAMLVFPGGDMIGLILIAVMLAPTDAALGQAVVSNHRVPIAIRQGLKVESGLNDGLVLPVLIVVVILQQAQGVADPVELFLETFLEEVGFGLLAGLLVGLVGGYLVKWSALNRWASPNSLGIAEIGVAAIAYGLAKHLHGSAFIAAFVAGLVLGHLTRNIEEEAEYFGHDLVEIATMIAFATFGGAVFGPALGELTAQVVVYAALSLTLVRMIPVATSFLGTRLNWRTTLFCGWFGPRGVASVLFAYLVVRVGFDFDGSEVVEATVTWTVAFSVLLHGITAWPLSNRYGAWYDREGRGGPEDGFVIGLARRESLDK